MEYTVNPMNFKAAREISTWKYPPPYAIYNMEADWRTLVEMLRSTFFTVYRGYQLAGFFCYGRSARIGWAEKQGYYAPSYTDIGLAMNPALTGQGLGLDFFKLGLNHARVLYPGRPIRLTVANFNERARKVYLRAGFQEVAEFTVPNGLEFTIMVEGSPKGSQ